MEGTLDFDATDERVPENQLGRHFNAGCDGYYL
jgi:hypothetical protein